MPKTDRQDELYQAVANDFGSALARLARAYEADSDIQHDLLQEMHLNVWRSLAVFDGRCSLRTWVYRVANNTGASHVLRRQRLRLDRMISIDEIVAIHDQDDPTQAAEDCDILVRLTALIHSLRPLDRQLILLYLEGLDAATIGEVTGLSPGAVATKIHRIKAALANRFHTGGHA